MPFESSYHLCTQLIVCFSDLYTTILLTLLMIFTNNGDDRRVYASCSLFKPALHGKTRWKNYIRTSRWP